MILKIKFSNSNRGMSLKLYLDLMSPPCRAVHMFLRLTGIPFETIRVDIGKKKQMTPEFLAVNPFHKVPVLTDGSTTIRESASMFRYLAASREVEDHWYPIDDPRESAVVEEYLHWQHRNLLSSAANLFQNAFVIPNMTGKPVHFGMVHRWLKMYEQTCSEVESVFLAKGNYVGNRSQISVADLAVVTTLMNPDCIGFEIGEKFGKLREYVERVSVETQPYFDEANKLMPIVKKKFAAKIQEEYANYVSQLPKEESDSGYLMSLTALAKK